MNRAEPHPPVEAIVLAAGKGTRMKSDLAKVLHTLAGRPLLAHVLDTVRTVNTDRIIVIVGHQAAAVREACAAPDLTFVIQEPQNGTGHAVQVGAPHLTPGGHTIVLSGDVPLLGSATLGGLIAQAVASTAGAVVLTCEVADAGAYGRIVRDAQGQFMRIVEARDASEAERAIGEFNAGIYCFRTDVLLMALTQLSSDNDQQELYLTDTIAHLVAAGEQVETCTITDPDEVAGINTVAELAAAEQLYQQRRA